MTPRALSTLVLLSVLNAAPAPAQDFPFSIPVDGTSGFVTGQGQPTPYEGAIRVGLLWKRHVGQLRFGPVAAAQYTNPSWGLAGGARVGWRVPKVGLRNWGLFVEGEVLAGERRTPISLAAVLQVWALRTGVWATRDAQLDRTSIALLLGVDVGSVLATIGEAGPHVVNPD